MEEVLPTQGVQTENEKIFSSFHFISLRFASSHFAFDNRRDQ